MNAERKRIHAWLKWVLERKGWTPERAAAASGVSVQTIRRGLQPKLTTLMRQDNISAIRRAARLPGPDEWENTQSGVGELEPHNVPVVPAPIISWAQAGIFMQTGDDSILADCERILSVPHTRDSVFALRMRGDAINVFAGEGALITVDYADQTLADRRYYVVRHDGDLIARRFRANPDRLEPHSHNPAHETIFLDEPPEVVGRIVLSLREG